MKCRVCGEWVEPDDNVFALSGEVMHHECCNLIEQGLSLGYDENIALINAKLIKISEKITF